MRLLVVGASAAGLACACRARRLLPDAAITVLDERFEISLARELLPAYLAGERSSLDDLRLTTAGRRRDEDFYRDVKRIEVRAGWRVTTLDLAARTVTAAPAAGGAAEVIAFDHLVLATGTAARVPAGVVCADRVRMGTDPLHLRALRADLERGAADRVAVIGGGCTGASLAAALAETWGAAVTLLEAADRILPEILDGELAAIAARALGDLGVDVRTGTRAIGTRRQADGAVAVATTGGDVAADAVLVAAGVEPRVEFARAAGLPIGATGGLIVDAGLACADRVWAGGDGVELTHRVTGSPWRGGRGGLAARMGRLIAERIAGSTAEFSPVLGTVCLRLGEVTVAATGLTAAAATASGRASLIVWGSCAGTSVCDPERRYDAMALVTDDRGERILGAQAIGAGAPARRVDVAAAVLGASGRVADLLALESCAHPAAGDPFDPWQRLATLAGRVSAGSLRLASPCDPLDDALLIDVREPHELTGDLPALPGALNVPLGELPRRLDELPRDRRVVIACARGPRSVEAISSLLIKDSPYIYVLAGGVGLWRSR